jgi:SIR2-like domain
MTTSLNEYARIVAERMRRRRVVPFLGAGVNLADRASGGIWQPGRDLPSGAELAKTFAGQFPYPAGEPTDDLMRVTQYVEASVGATAVYDELREVFAGTYQPTVVHRVLARIPRLLAERGVEHPYLLIVTTNYDDAQEQAFDDEGQEYDVLWYIARGEARNQFMHQGPGGTPSPIDDPSMCPLGVDDRNVIIKIHGAAYRPTDTLDSYVITEDDYIEYMSTTDLTQAVPVKLLKTMLDSHFLFLGYRLGDWNLRVFLHSLWGRRDRTANSWSVNRSHSDLDRLFWQKRSVEMVEASLSEYMAALNGVFA